MYRYDIFECLYCSFIRRFSDSKWLRLVIVINNDSEATYDVYPPHSFQTDLPSDTILLLIR